MRAAKTDYIQRQDIFIIGIYFYHNLYKRTCSSSCSQSITGGNTLRAGQFAEDNLICCLAQIHDHRLMSRGEDRPITARQLVACCNYREVISVRDRNVYFTTPMKTTTIITLSCGATIYQADPDGGCSVIKIEFNGSNSGWDFTVQCVGDLCYGVPANFSRPFTSRSPRDSVRGCIGCGNACEGKGNKDDGKEFDGPFDEYIISPLI
jgi:hypothetical protein